MNTTTLSLPGDVWEILDEWETSIPVGNFFTVDHIDEEGFYIALCGRKICNEFITNGWVKRVR